MLMVVETYYSPKSLILHSFFSQIDAKFYFFNLRQSAKSADHYFSLTAHSIFSKNWGHEYSRFGKEQIDSTDAICSFLDLLYSPRNIEMLLHTD